MSTDSPTAPVIDPAPFSFGIVCARFNEGLTQHLLDRVLEVLEEHGKPADLVVERVPGSHEVPAGLSLLAETGRFSSLIGLGVVIKGSTSHHHLVAVLRRDDEGGETVVLRLRFEQKRDKVQRRSLGGKSGTRK